MKPCWIAVLVAVFAATVALGVPAAAGAGETFRAKLTARQEAPVCSSQENGTFHATLSEDETTVEYELTYGLEGTVTQAHIHLGQKGVSGGISVWLCQTPPGLTDPTGLSPMCPNSGTVTGSFTQANMVGPTNQGIAGSPSGASNTEFAELVHAMRSGLTYANVHSDICPSGEIRGQIIKKGGKD